MEPHVRVVQPPGVGVSFYDATAVRRRPVALGSKKSEVASDVVVYDGYVPTDWCMYGAAFGGYLASLLTRTLDQHVLLTASSTPTPLATVLDTCNLTYIEAVVPGPVEIRIQEIELSKHFGYYRGSIWQKRRRRQQPHQQSKPTPSATANTNGNDGYKLVLCTENTMSLASAVSFTRSIDFNGKPLLKARSRIAVSDMFSRTDKENIVLHVPHLDSGNSFYQFKPGYQCIFQLTPSLNPAKLMNPHHVLGPAVFDVWWKFDEKITLQHFGLLADIVGPILMNFEEAKKLCWLRTRGIGFDVVRLPASAEVNGTMSGLTGSRKESKSQPENGQLSGWEWVFCRMELVESVGERFWVDVTFADEHGRVICIAKHQCVLKSLGVLNDAKKKEVEKKKEAKL